jgi:hypothetical protein
VIMTTLGFSDMEIRQMMCLNPARIIGLPA